MALIKALEQNGQIATYWTIQNINIDFINNTSTIVLYLFINPNTRKRNFNNYIKKEGITLQGIFTTKTESYNQLILQSEYFKNAVYIDNDSVVEESYRTVSKEISDQEIDLINYKRNAMVIDYLDMPYSNTLILNLQIEYYLDGIPKYELYKNVSLCVDNQFKFNGTEIGEYDYFNQIRMEQNIQIEEIIKMGIKYADMLGYINNKL